MLSISEIVGMINDKLCALIPNMQLYRIAQIVAKESATMPAENEKYIGIDDSYPAQLYHKVLGITIAKQPSGFGDDSNVLYSYQMAMIIFLNRNRVAIRPEDLVIMIQGSLPQSMKAKNVVYVNINFVSANLNDQQIFAQEYKDASLYKIDLNQNLFQINYNLEVLYKPGCFEICPTEEICHN